MPLHLLIADDDAASIKHLAAYLRDAGVQIEIAATSDQALASLETGRFDALIANPYLTGELGGKELIHRILAEFAGLAVFIHTQRARADDAFQFARLGVRAYVVTGEDEAGFARQVLEQLQGSEENAGVARRMPFSQYVSRNARTAEMWRDAMDKIASAGSTVLISGESGTGKELLARTIHAAGARRNGPFVAVNCGALPDSLIESELFGHEKGAFTGAVDRRIGRFEAASGGTFFLDEAADLSAAMQVKLLRVMQERVIERVGSNKPVPIDVRVIAASNRALKELIAQKKFREDLYYRLSVIELELPPLRERPEDIAGLSLYFLRRFRKQMGLPPLILTPAALAALQAYSWPGNVRELANVIERAVVLSRGGRIDLTGLPEPVRMVVPAAENPLDLRAARAEFEKDFILRALARSGGNISETSAALGLARKNLQEKLRRYGIDADAIREAAKQQRQDQGSGDA